MLNYVVTVAISAYFVPHYIGGLFAPLDFLSEAPGDIVFGMGVIAVLCVVNVLGAEESAGLNIALAVVDPRRRARCSPGGLLAPRTLTSAQHRDHDAPPRTRCRRRLAGSPSGANSPAMVVRTKFAEIATVIVVGAASAPRRRRTTRTR
jgi:hypothetical protein